MIGTTSRSVPDRPPSRATTAQSNRLDTDSSDAVRPMASRDQARRSRACGCWRDLWTASVGWIEFGDHEFFQLRRGDAGRGAAGQHAMGDIGVDFLGAVGEQRVGGVHQRAAGIDDVVDQDAGVARDLADHVHDLGFAGAFAALVDDRQRRVDALGKPARAHHAADVGRHHHDIGEVEAFLDVAHHHRRGVEVVGRDVEEALDLPGMQVERHDAVDAGMGDQIGDQLGRDRRARAGLAVLPGVAEIRESPR